MKEFISFILLLLMFSCSENELIDKQLNEIQKPIKENPLGLCDNEIELLRSDAQEKIVFDFNHCIKAIKSNDSCDEFNFIENQTDIDLCDGPWHFSTDMILDSNKIININLMADKYCENQPSFIRACPRIEEILINANSQILIEGEYIRNDDSLVYNMANSLYRDYIEDEYYKEKGKVFVTIQWDRDTPKEMRVHVFESMIKAYLLESNKLSKNLFNSEICNLNKNEIDSLKKTFSFNMLIMEFLKPEIPITMPVVDVVIED